MVALFPEGFEEIDDGPDRLELAAYTDERGAARIERAFGHARAVLVPPDWPDRWRAFHRPARVGRLWIGAPWEPRPEAAVPVVIDPGAAFGTGAHPTTRLCLQALLSLPRGSLVDLGCGSGVVAIAAAKLGFEPVVALDVDPAAVAATASNAAANEVELDVRLADALTASVPETDVAVANIALETVERLGRRIRGDWLITSGYFVAERPRIPGFWRLVRHADAGWAADVYARRGRLTGGR